MCTTKFITGRFVKRAVILLALAGVMPSAQAANKFNATLEGQSVSNSVWQAGGLSGWQELDLIPCRMRYSGGAANNQTIVLQFDHTKSSTTPPLTGIQNLFYFTNSPGVTFVSGPTLSAPVGVDTWYYTYVVNVTASTNVCFTEFRSRLSAGSHNFTGSSLALKGLLNGSPSPGVLQIYKSAPGLGTPDLVVTKLGPAFASPGSTITYTLNYTNKAGGTVGAQLTDSLPGALTFGNCSGGCYLVGNLVTWDVGSIPAGGSGSVTYTAVVTNNAVNGSTFKNSVALLSADNDNNPSDNYASVTTTITSGCIPPSISSNPAGLTNCPGTPATFSVGASGTTLHYQWRKDGTNISGATGSSYAIASASAANVGSYNVVVTNLCGSVTSSAAPLALQTLTTADPLVSQTNCPGATVSFSTTAHGTGPFTYQWSKGGAPLSSQTDNSLILTGITAASAGTYAVQVTGSCNSVTNSASLTVNTLTTADALVSQTNCAGATVTFSTAAQGTGPFTYQWAKNGAPLSGKTDASLTLPGVTTTDTANYSVRVTGTCNSVTNSASLTVNTLTTADALVSQTNCAGTTVTFSTAAQGTGPFTYQWAKNGAPLPGKTDASLTLPGVTTTDTANYSVRVTGTCNSVTNSASLTVNTLTTADALVPQTNCAGATVSFSTAAHGTGPFTYQWSKDGALLPGKTDASLTLPSVTTADTANYSVRVTGTCNSVTNSASLTVNTLTTADALVSQTNCAGTTVTFSTAAHGTGPFTYQWSKDGAPLPGKTDASLTLPGVTTTDTANYSVRVTGTCNSVTNSASLTVNTLTTADALVSQTNCAGATVTFSTAAHGTGPFTYQWSKDGVPLPDRTDSSLTLAGIGAASDGTYSVRVTGACNSVTNSAKLTVNLLTTADALVSQTACPGDAVTFSAVAQGTGPFSYQWRKDGKVVTGATGSVLTLNNVTALDADTYSVTINGTCNSVTKSATLSVNRPTTATSMADQTICFVRDATFSTKAGGTGPFSYVWKKDGLLLADRTDSSITITNAGAADAGAYTVEVAGRCNSVTNSARLTVLSDGLPTPVTFANGQAITITDFSPATPYPSTIEVSCVPTLITNVTVTVSNLSHSYAADISMLLVGPAGQTVMLMTDAGDNSAIVNATLGFGDAAADFLPEAGPIVSGVYKPTSYDALDSLPPGAPGGPYGSSFTVFNGTDANGTWSLYVADHAAEDAGMIAGGWSLTIGWDSALLPPKLTSPTVTGKSSPQATLVGQPGQTYIIEASTDLINWTAMCTNTLNGNCWSFVDEKATNFSARFYRAVRKP
jgi:subtilisin-like proprotein convertase family protein